MNDQDSQDSQAMVRPLTLVWVGVQALVAICGFLMIHTLDRVNSTIDAAMHTLIDHERRIATIEGEFNGGRRGQNDQK